MSYYPSLEDLEVDQLAHVSVWFCAAAALAALCGGRALKASLIAWFVFCVCVRVRAPVCVCACACV